MKVYEPYYKVPPRVYRLLEDISAARERIRNSLVRIPWVPSMVMEARARLAWGSTAIEGCTLSLEAVKNLLKNKEARGYPDKHIRMAKNYLGALSWIQKKEKAHTIKESDTLLLHKKIGEEAVDEGPVGEYRKQDVSAGLHKAPAWKDVPRLMRELLAWLNGPSRDLPAVFSSAILHLRFAEIHPFRDGNGRVARLLATWELYRRGFDTLHVFSLDEVLLENRSFYIKNLQRVQVEGEDLGGWLEFMAEAFLETLDRVERRIQSLGPVGKPVSLTLRQEKLLRLLREKGEAGIREIARYLRVTVPGAHYAMKPLMDAGLIVRIGTHKKSRYSLSS